MSSPAVPIFGSTPGAATRERARLSFMFWSSPSACLCRCKEIIEPVRVAGQMRKKLMLAIVDEESDITFYEAREKAMSGLMAEEEEGGMATLLEDRVVLWDAEASSRLHEHGFYGKPVGERLQLSLVESAYLLEKGLIQLNDRSGDTL